jgi:hypothetical protein
MNPMKQSKYTALLMYSMLHKQTANKCNTCTGCRLLGEGTFVYLAGAEVQTASPCVKCNKKEKTSLW